MYKKKNSKVPFPEIASGEGPWKIYDDANQPRTSTLSHEMYVPTDDELCSLCGSNHNKQIRRHELGHAKWSPKTVGKLKENENEKCIEICEEIRINYNLGIKDIYLDDWVVCQPIHEERAIDLFYNSSLFDIVSYIMICMAPIETNSNSYYSGRRPASKEFASLIEIFEDLREIPRDSAKALTNLRLNQINWCFKQANNLWERITYTRGYYKKPSKYIKTRNAAKILFKLMEQFSEPPKEEQVLEQARKAALAKQKANSANKQTSGNSSEGEGDDIASLDELMSRNAEQMFEMTSQSNSNMNYKPNLNDMAGKWGKMQIFKPHLEVNLQSKIKGGREYRPMDYGVNPKYMNRWCVDKKVFKQKQRVYGGTILIDASGSMSFSGEDILEIMQMLPAVTIAMYNDRGQDWETGSLRIIGQNGKRVNQDYLDRWTGGGNLVDGPALAWLAKQPPKRIWVSDMYVFGLHNSNSNNLLKDCIEQCKRSGITRLADVDEVKEFAYQLNQLQ
jgi:hypothetical protein